MGLNAPLALREMQIEQLDRFTKLNVLGLLGQSIREVDHGNEERAMLYLATALIAIKSKKVSFVLQGVLVVDRMFGQFTGERPLNAVLRGPR